MTKWLLYMMIPVMLLQSNMTLVILTSFHYNQNYIEKYLCIQRNMENSHCHGQCYLMKKLKDKQENEQKNFKVYFQEANLDLAKRVDLPPVEVCNIIKLKYPLYLIHPVSSDYNSAVFRPPILA